MPEPLPIKTRWEFYLGGIGGLLLGFVVRAMGQTPDGVLVEGAMAAVRSLIWLMVFALVYALPWSGRGKVLALAGGVTALLLNLLVSGGINFPSVAQPLWVMVALTLNALPIPTAEPGKTSIGIP